jgi:hypothetical protein
MSIIDSITGIFSSKEEPKKAAAKKAASRKAQPRKAATAVKKTGAAPAMASHSKDGAANGKSGQPKGPAKKKAAR